ncbi:DUF2577 domain-containing protein [Lactiplantibacillus plajomi]|uniref:DUF2577 domain-containing protein n=1 Tax=Lactiplantibacillus plajomi TaxID=1457217 RepID=A0ABV6K0U8_9LACO|nr:DUF2577 domain-containing protein [Lactiplantibacillus plajomi]
MAGQWLLSQLKSKGGKDADYADVVYGTVVSTAPLQIQYSNSMILTSSFLTLGRAVSDYETTIKIDGSDKKVKIKNGLRSGDHVAMIRGDGGQTFYVFDKL